jgi:hypothetical protein
MNWEKGLKKTNGNESKNMLGRHAPPKTRKEIQERGTRRHLLGTETGPYNAFSSKKEAIDAIDSILRIGISKLHSRILSKISNKHEHKEIAKLLKVIYERDKEVMGDLRRLKIYLESMEHD